MCLYHYTNFQFYFQTHYEEAEETKEIQNVLLKSLGISQQKNTRNHCAVKRIVQIWYRLKNYKQFKNVLNILVV